MKKSLLLIMSLVLTLSLVLSGCAPKAPEPAPAPAPAETPATPAEPAAPQEVIKVRFGHNLATTTPMHAGAEAFKQKVEELSGGQIEVTIFPSMQLGQMREQAEQVQAGTLQITQQPASVISNFDQSLEVYDIPFLFANLDALQEVVEGEVGMEILKGLEDNGFKGLGYQTGGLKQMYGATPFRGPQDLAGLKMRVMPAPILVETYKTLGANPITIEFGELYNALQQGVADGMENPMQTVNMLKMYEVQDAATIVNIGPMLYITVANKAWFDSLTPELQANLLEAQAYADQIQWDAIRAEEPKYFENAKAGGMEIYYPTPEEMQAFREKAAPVNDFVAGRVGQDLVDRVLAAAEAANAKFAK